MDPDDTKNIPSVPGKTGSAPSAPAPFAHTDTENAGDVSLTPEAVSSVWKQLQSNTEATHPGSPIIPARPQQTLYRKESTSSLEPGVPETERESSPEPTDAALEAPEAQPEVPIAPRIAPGMVGYASVLQTSAPAARTGRATEPLRPSLFTRIRTYKSDVAAFMKGNKTSLTDIALAGEKKKREAAPALQASLAPSTKNGRKKHPFLVILIVLLVLIGAGMLVFVVFFSPKNQPAIVNNVVATPLIFSDKNEEIDITRKARGEITAAMTRKVQAIKLSLGSVEYLYITEGAGTEKKVVQTERLLQMLEARAPASLVRALESNFMFGGHVFDGNQPFLIFKTTFFENAFAGMLQWEDDLAFDLGSVFARAIPTATSTLSENIATQTPARVARATVPLTERRFADAVVENKDARVLRDANGKIIFLYTFADRDTLIMTTNEYTLKEILYRMTTLRFVP